MSKNNLSYKAAIYLRLSKDDGDKIESDSISNQRDLIYDYVKSMPEIEVCDEMVDDGYSGSNFDRPEFKRLIDEINQGNINCVIVKDLSRFARNYNGSNYYLKKLFPQVGVRFISINDYYDTATSDGGTNDEIILFFKNIMNDAYIRDISVKIRSQLAIKRKKGEFIGAFATYGYLKSPQNRHKLIVDEKAAEIVQSIFFWRMDGMSAQAIANKLNDLGVPSPSEHKKMLGLNYETGFKEKRISLWSAQTINRILKNEIYIGVLEQGKETTPNHKVKKVIQKSKDEWVRIEDAHDAIIGQDLFKTVNELMKRDTRTSPYKEKSFLFSGLIFCNDCRQTMVRRKVKTKKYGNYVYYLCSTHKAKLGCSCHNIKEETLYQMTFTAIREHIKVVMSMQDMAQYIDTYELEKADYFKIEKMIEAHKEEIKKDKGYIVSTYQNFCDGIIGLDEYNEYKAMYEDDIASKQDSIVRLEIEAKNIMENREYSNEWIKKFVDVGNIDSITRKLLVMLIDSIYIADAKKINIIFKYQDKFDRLYKFLSKQAKVTLTKGAV